MDPILQILVSWQFIIFGLAVASVVFVVRKVVEYSLASASLSKESKLWADVILPILPVVIGAVGAFFFTGFPYPDGLITSGSRVIFGLVAGLLSTVLYRVVNALLGQKIAIAMQAFSNNSTPNVITPVAVIQPTEQIPPDEISKRGRI